MRQPEIMLSVRLVVLLLWGVSVFAGGGPAQTSSVANKEKVDVIINGGPVITMDGNGLILEDGPLVVKGDVISAIVFRTDLEKKYIADHTADARGNQVLPGLRS